MRMGTRQAVVDPVAVLPVGPGEPAKGTGRNWLVRGWSGQAKVL